MKNIKFTAGLTALALGGLFINGSIASAQLPTITLDTSNNTTISVDPTAGGTALNPSPEPTIMPGTSAALDAGVNALIKDTSSAEGEEYCLALVKSFNAQDTDIRGSFAWNADSYNRNLEASGDVSTDQKALFEITKKTIDDANTHLSKVNAGGDDAKFRVVVRSALVSLSSEFKKSSGPDAERVNNLNKLISNSLSCMNALSNSGDEEHIKHAKDSVLALAASWDEKKGSFGDTTVTTKTTVKDETVAYKESAKFLGFIPSKLTSKVVVKADGSITVKRPWYRFLFSQKSHKGIDEVQKVIDDNKIDIKTSGDAEARAKALESLSVTLNADTNVEVK
jgi:hypothetical protein